MKATRALLFLILLVISRTVRADDEPHAHGAPPERLGKVEFPVSCSSSARPHFVRGVALLHSFWYDAAEKAFRDAAQADPACAMAYWGVAMANVHFVWAAANPAAEPSRAELAKGVEAVAKAKAAGAPTERERDYISAIEAYYRDADKIGHHTRAVSFETAMERVSSKYPSDHEAGIFYALAILGTSSPEDKTYAPQKKAAEILNRLLAEAPEHPGIAHYLIHSYDYPVLAPLALDAARSYARVAPDSPHALHMPSHIFTRLGLWEDSIQSNVASAEAARRYVEKSSPGAASFDGLHAEDYLEYAYLQLARDDDARAVVESVARVERLDVPNFAAAYALAAVPVRYAIERRDWNRASRLEVRPKMFPWEKFRSFEAILHFGRAMGAARSGDFATAREEAGRLDAIAGELKQKGDAYWAGQVEIQRLEAASWIARGEHKDEEALGLARSAAALEDSTEKHPVTPGAIAPARELLGDMLLELGRPAAALAEYEASLSNCPNRFRGLAGAARSAREAGDSAKARTYSQKLLDLAGKSAGREEIAAARAVVAAGK